MLTPQPLQEDYIRKRKYPAARHLPLPEPLEPLEGVLSQSEICCTALSALYFHSYLLSPKLLDSACAKPCMAGEIVQ
jgi:hypothetical protein